MAAAGGLALAADGRYSSPTRSTGGFAPSILPTGVIRNGCRGWRESNRIKERPSRRPVVCLGHQALRWISRDNVFLTDSDNHLVRRWDRTTGRLDRVAGIGVANYGGDGGPASEASLNYPFGIVVNGSGTLFIADTFNHRIREISS